VPYLSQWFFNGASGGPTSTLAYFSQTWFAHWVPYPGFRQRCLPNDYFHFVGSSNSTIEYGATYDRSNVTFDLVQAVLRDFGAGVSFKHTLVAVTSHELAHQFLVNPCECDHHDTRDSWCAGMNNCAHPSINHTISCLMNVTNNYRDNLTDGVDYLGVQDLWNGTGGCQNKTCPQGNSLNYPPGYGAVRTMRDPQ